MSEPVHPGFCGGREFESGRQQIVRVPCPYDSTAGMLVTVGQNPDKCPLLRSQRIDVLCMVS